MFADETKLRRVITSQQYIATIHKGLDKIKEWATIWQIIFNTDKYKVMHLVTKNKNASYTLEREPLWESRMEKEMGVLVAIACNTKLQLTDY